MREPVPHPVGSLVALHGLTRAELNGRNGRVISWDTLTCRHGVKLDDGGEGDPAKIAVKLDNLRARCDGCDQVVDGDAEAVLSRCHDCGYSLCKSCAADRSRGKCRCTGSNFGLRPDGTPTRTHPECVCSRCNRSEATVCVTAEGEAKRRRAGLLRAGDDVALLFAHESGASVLRFGRAQRITCRCLATRRLSDATWAGGVDVKRVRPEQQLEFVLQWYAKTSAPGAPRTYALEGGADGGDDRVYGAAGYVGLIELEYDEKEGSYALAEPALRELQSQARVLALRADALGETHAVAPEGVDLSGGEVVMTGV